MLRFVLVAHRRALPRNQGRSNQEGPPDTSLLAKSEDCPPQNYFLAVAIFFPLYFNQGCQELPLSKESFHFASKAFPS